MTEPGEFDVEALIHESSLAIIVAGEGEEVFPHAATLAALPVFAKTFGAPLRELHSMKAVDAAGVAAGTARNGECRACHYYCPCPTVRVLDSIDAAIARAVEEQG